MKQNSQKQSVFSLRFRLAPVREILQLEKGQILAENLPGGGCRFTVLLENGI